MGNYYEDSIVESKLIKRNKLNMFDNKKLHTFLYLSFTNTLAYNKAKKIFYDETFDNGYYEKTLKKDGFIFNNEKIVTNCYLYEGDIPPLLKLFHIKQISPSGWVSFPMNRLIIIKEKTTHCYYEYVINYENIIPIKNIEAPVKYNICSFDIEASSSHGDFPVAIKDYKKLATNILENYNNLSEKDKEDYGDDLLKKEIFAAFGYSNLKYIQPVYTKYNINDQLQLENIFDNFIKYIPVNDKNRKNYTLEIEESDSESDDEDNQPVESIKKIKKVKKYNKNANIFEIITDDKCEYETKLLELNKALTKFYPQLKGDIITFIGMTFINYSEKKPYVRYIIVKGGCKIPEKYKNWVQENHVKIIEKSTEKGVLLNLLKLYNLKIHISLLVIILMVLIGILCIKEQKKLVVLMTF